MTFSPHSSTNPIPDVHNTSRHSHRHQPGGGGDCTTSRNQAIYEYPIPGKCNHIVQFYDSESHLYDAVSSFLLTSFFSSQQAAIVVATGSHIAALEHQLFHQHCLFPEVMKRRGQLLMCEAEGILEVILANGLTQDSFESFIIPAVRKLRQKGYEKVLVYGELVNILCERGRHYDALQLEKIWNVFLQGPVGLEHGVELLCGYKMDVFALDDSDLQFVSIEGFEEGGRGYDFQSTALREICKTHSDVRPTEKATGEPSNDAGGKQKHLGELYSGSASAADTPRALMPVPDQPVMKEQRGMVIAVLQHRIRMLEKQAQRFEEREQDLRRLFGQLPTGIFSATLPLILEKGKSGTKSADRGKATLAPKGRGRKLTSPVETGEQPAKYPPLTNPAFAELLGLDKIQGSGSGPRIPTDHRDWISKFVHPDDREKLIRSVESGTAASHGPREDICGEYRSRCTYRVVHPDGQIRWLVGETVGEIKGNGNVANMVSQRERGYVHVITDLTEMMGSLKMHAQQNEETRIDEEASGAGNGGTYSKKRRATEDPNHSPLSSHSHFNFTKNNNHQHHEIQHSPHVSLDALHSAPLHTQIPNNNHDTVPLHGPHTGSYPPDSVGGPISH